MPVTIGAAAGNRDLTEIHIGTSGGNRLVTQGWVGTAAGNRQFYSSGVSTSVTLTATDVVLSPNAIGLRGFVRGQGGVVSPTALNGRGILQFGDVYTLPAGTAVGFRLHVDGFTGDPGQSSLVSVGPLSSASANYSYSGGAARWDWNIPLSIQLGVNPPLPIVHSF